MQPIKAIIFDLGGIFLNIDYQRTEDAFTALGVKDFNRFFQQQYSNPLFEDLETGKIRPKDFYDRFNEEAGTDLAYEAIEKAWNAMLLDFPEERINWLKEKARQYPVYLYSNTNIIHYESFMQDFGVKYGYDFNELFVKAYYSHQLGLRKPYPNSYKAILMEQQLEAATTLFIDDTPKNIVGAQEAGLQTILLNNGKTVLDLDL